MLEEILHVVKEAKLVDDVILVSRDESAFDIGKNLIVLKLLTKMNLELTTLFL